MLGPGGIVCVVKLPEASKIASGCLQRLRHRGQDILGIFAIEKENFRAEFKTPYEGNDFQGFNFANELPGDIAIGFCSDIKDGANNSKNVRQPLMVSTTRFGEIVIAISGKIRNTNNKTPELFEARCRFSQDYELDMIIRTLASSRQENLKDAVIETLSKTSPAFSIVIATKKEVFIARDRCGIFPLSIGRLREGFIICSEDIAFKQNPRVQFLEEVEPGEIIAFNRDDRDFRILRFSDPDEHLCAIECIHMGNPVTNFHGKFHEDFRQELGRQLFREHSEEINGDFVLPVMRSGIDQGTGMEDESQIPYAEYFKLDENRPRTRNRPVEGVIYEKAWERSHKKMILRKDKIKNRRPIVVDGIMISSINMRIINERLRLAGARYITNCITAPMVTRPCPFGMEHDNEKMLIAKDRTIEEIRILIGADKLFFLSLEGLENILFNTYRSKFCTGCFGGKYPV